MNVFFRFILRRRAIEFDEEENGKNVLKVPSQELNAAITELSSKLENLRTCNDLISKNGRALQSALTELETGEDLASKTKLVTERATLFRISSNAMINVSNLHYIGHCSSKSKMFCVDNFEFCFFIFVHLNKRLAVITFKQLKVRDISGQKCYNMNVIRGNNCKKWWSRWQDNILT